MSLDRTVTLHPEYALHARPAARFVQLAKSFDAKVTVTKGDRSAPATSAIALMALDAGKGSTIVIHTEGSQESEAIEALSALVMEAR